MNWGAALYCIVMECIAWIGTGYVVFVLDKSGWWFLLGILVSGSAGVPEGVRVPFRKKQPSQGERGE